MIVLATLCGAAVAAVPAVTVVDLTPFPLNYSLRVSTFAAAGLRCRVWMWSASLPELRFCVLTSGKGLGFLPSASAC